MAAKNTSKKYVTEGEKEVVFNTIENFFGEDEEFGEPVSQPVYIVVGFREHAEGLAGSVALLDPNETILTHDREKDAGTIKDSSLATIAGMITKKNLFESLEDVSELAEVVRMGAKLVSEES